MAISSIHIEAGSSGYFAHNSREKKTSNAIFDDEQNYCSASKEDAFKLFREELKARTQAYEKRTNQKLQKNATTHLSAIFNFNKETTPEQAHKVCRYLEKRLDTKVVQMSMHRDEGHIIEEESKAIHDKIKINTAIKNYHGHIEMLGLDSQGNSIRRKLDKPTLREIQTEVAKLLNMERGRETSYNKEEYLKITAELKPQNEYADKKEYNKAFTEKAKELGLYKERKAKRLDTYEYKQAKEMESKALKEKEKDLLATKDQLKEANNQLRAYMKENGANRADYAELEREKKELEEKLKAKLLTEKELLEKFQQLEKNFKKEKSHLESVIEVKNIDIVELETQNKSLEEQKDTLASKVTTLQEKINSSSNMSYPQPPNDVRKEFELIKKEEFEEKNIKTGLFATEKAKVLKSESNFLQRTWNLVASKYEDLKSKYNDLVYKFKDLQKENAVLKAELEELKERSSTKQQKEKTKDHLAQLVENLEASTGIESDSSFLKIKDVQAQMRAMKKNENDLSKIAKTKEPNLEEKEAKKKRSFLSR